jgi:hypothetical protein
MKMNWIHAATLLVGGGGEHENELDPRSNFVGGWGRRDRSDDVLVFGL